MGKRKGYEETKLVNTSNNSKQFKRAICVWSNVL